jgi:hypothetical protein
MNERMNGTKENNSPLSLKLGTHDLRLVFFAQNDREKSGKTPKNSRFLNPFPYFSL